ncbi:MAG: hypothetical protein NZ519_07650 [Bacteroidia bacterium]|nr:hypothetical protein [Bacteroidia bacterium]
MPTRSACYGLRCASVLRFATHRANARPPHASRKKPCNSLQGFFTLLLHYKPLCFTSSSRSDEIHSLR